MGLTSFSPLALPNPEILMVSFGPDYR